MFTRDQFDTDPVRFYTGPFWNRSGTDPKLDCCFAGPVLDSLRTSSRKVSCKHLDRFQTVPREQKPIRSGPVRFGVVPVRSRVNVALLTLFTVNKILRD